MRRVCTSHAHRRVRVGSQLGSSGLLAGVPEPRSRWFRPRRCRRRRRAPCLTLPQAVRAVGAARDAVPTYGSCALLPAGCSCAYDVCSVLRRKVTARGLQPASNSRRTVHCTTRASIGATVGAWVGAAVCAVVGSVVCAIVGVIVGAIRVPFGGVKPPSCCAVIIALSTQSALLLLRRPV
jgi:hypothetical protein